MKNALIIHGMPSRESYYDEAADSQSNCHWLPWIQQQLLIRDVLAQTPEMPRPYEPVYKNWLEIFKNFEVGPETILIGHSCGGGFIVKWLTEANAKVGKVILVAPWIDLNNNIEMFKDFEVSSDLVNKTVNGITIFNSDNDDKDIQKSAKLIKELNPKIKFREFHNYGHFCYKDMRTCEFPELLEEVIS